MGVKFKSGLCNCAPSNIEGYGKYTWTKGSAAKLLDIPKFPEELFEIIRCTPTTPTPAAIAPRVEAAPVATTPTTATAKDLQDIKAL